MGDRYTHPMFTHRDGSQCIWVDGAWFVPLDVGGEGHDCPQDHPVPPALLAEIDGLKARLDAVTALTRMWDQWDAYARLHYGETTEGPLYSRAVRTVLNNPAAIVAITGNRTRVQDGAAQSAPPPA